MHSKIKDDVYIIPCTCTGIVIYHILKRCGINVAAFCDNSENYSGKSYDGVPVIAPDEAFANETDASFIVASSKYHTDIVNQLESLGAESAANPCAKTILNTSDILTRESFINAVDDMDDAAVAELTGISNPRENAFRFAPDYWFCDLNNGISTLRTMYYRLNIYFDDKSFEAFKKSFDINREGRIFSGRITFHLYLENIAPHANTLGEILDYVGKHSLHSSEIIILLDYSKTNKENINELCNILRSFGISVRDSQDYKYELSDTPLISVIIRLAPAYSDSELYYKCVNVHIPKTAGRSMVEYLSVPGGKYHNHHKTAVDCRDANLERFRSFFKFAIVRNPWDLLVSSYFYSYRVFKDLGWSVEGVNNIHLEPKTFRNFIFDIKDSLRFLQSDWICNENGEILVDYVGRFENLEESFRYIGSKLGIDPGRPIPHINASKHTRYQDYYDEETIEIVRKVYKKDIEIFGYEFDKHPGPNIIINSRDDFIPVTRK